MVVRDGATFWAWPMDNIHHIIVTITFGAKYRWATTDPFVYLYHRLRRVRKSKPKTD